MKKGIFNIKFLTISLLIFFLMALGAYSEDFILGCCTNPYASGVICHTEQPNIDLCCPASDPGGIYYRPKTITDLGPENYNECIQSFFIPNTDCENLTQCGAGCCCNKAEGGGEVLSESACGAYTFHRGQGYCAQLCPAWNCNDGIDNDGNGCFDFNSTNSDSGCSSERDDTEEGGTCQTSIPQIENQTGCCCVDNQVKAQNDCTCPAENPNCFKTASSDSNCAEICAPQIIQNPCGNSSCDSEIGEICETCPADCGECVTQDLFNQSCGRIYRKYEQKGICDSTKCGSDIFLNCVYHDNRISNVCFKVIDTNCSDSPLCNKNLIELLKNPCNVENSDGKFQLACGKIFTHPKKFYMKPKAKVCENQNAYFLGYTKKSWWNKYAVCMNISYTECSENPSCNKGEIELDRGICQNDNSQSQDDEFVCTDSDGGKNYTLKGTVKGKSGEDWSEKYESKTRKLTDKCSDAANLVGSEYEGLLFEGYCDENGTVQIENHQCESKICKDGVCISPTCSDSDGGWNLLTAGKIYALSDIQSNTGIIKKGDILCEDKCESQLSLNDSVYECFCGNKEGSGRWQGSVNVICAHGCENGTCNNVKLNCSKTYPKEEKYHYGYCDESKCNPDKYDYCEQKESRMMGNFITLIKYREVCIQEYETECSDNPTCEEGYTAYKRKKCNQDVVTCNDDWCPEQCWGFLDKDKRDWCYFFSKTCDKIEKKTLKDICNYAFV